MEENEMIGQLNEKSTNRLVGMKLIAVWIYKFLHLKLKVLW